MNAPAPNTNENAADARISQSHHLVQAVNGERREHVPAPVAGVAHFFRRLQNGGGRIKFRDEAVGFFAHDFAPFTPPSERCGSACGVTAFTSETGIIGRNRTNSRYNMKNAPSVPRKMPASTHVG